MKKLVLFLFLFALVAGAFAQKIEGRFTPSGGILGAVNFSKFGISGNNTDEVSFKFKTGYSFGAWLAIPLDQTVSFEPQVLYSSYAYEYTGTGISKTAYDLKYLSVPLLFKFHLSKVIAVTAGPQLDFSIGNSNKNGAATDKNYYSGTDFSLSGGLELFPRSRVSLYGRYIAGLLNKDNAGADIKVRNQTFQAGIKLRLFGGKFIPSDTDGDGIPNSKDKCPTVAGLERYQGCPIPDTDGDGINDEADKCPTVAGLAKYEGCPIPDTDKDGINDEADKCPTVPGIERYQGCPIPDTDNDGVNDEEDKCKDVPGLARLQGCPIADRDNDGVNDEEDKCPDVAGPADNGGCPSLETSKFNASAVQFVTGSATLTTKAKKTLDEGAKILNEQFAQLKVEIDGHTDNTGKAEANKTLSQKRADAVKAYLVKKGVAADRLSTVGFGQEQPIADNATADGKAKNRRVEFKVSQ
jgi:outer membrane protein OmpA-like peptidoglycan-associated protein